MVLLEGCGRMWKDVSDVEELSQAKRGPDSSLHSPHSSS